MLAAVYTCPLGVCPTLDPIPVFPDVRSLKDHASSHHSSKNMEQGAETNYAIQELVDQHIDNHPFWTQADIRANVFKGHDSKLVWMLNQ